MLRLRLAARPLYLLACAVSLSAQTTHTWQGPLIADWSAPGNWSTGQIPDAAGDTVIFNNTEGPGADYQIAPPFPPATIGHITVSNTSAANSVILGASADSTASLVLAATSGQPTISVSNGTLGIRGVLAGTQGFAKTGAGTLSFHDNTYAQLFSGSVTLAGGALTIGADHDLGHADNDLSVLTSATLLANPPAPAVPVVLGAGRDIAIATGSATLTVGNASDAGSLEIAGPITGSGTLRFNGTGTLVLSGANTHVGTLTHVVTSKAVLASSALKFVGAGAVRAAGKSFILNQASAGTSPTYAQTSVDLGNFPRSLHLNFNGGNTSVAVSTLVEFANGELTSDGALSPSSTLNVSTGTADSSIELRLPSVTTLKNHSLTIGINPTTTGNTVTTSRVRIGTRANFNLSQLRVGEAGASGRLDALVPGATLRIRNANDTGALSLLSLGNFYGGNAISASALIDLSDGILDAQVSDIYVGGGTPGYPVTAALRFGAGSVLQAGNITLGAGNSSVPANFDYSVTQTGGEARIAGVLRFNAGNATGNVASRYILRSGNLALTQLNASGNFTGALRPRLEWSGGTLCNYPLRSTAFSGPANPATPFEIVLSGATPKTLLVDGNYTMTIPASFKLANLDPEVVLAKTGSGTLALSAQTTGFTGALRLEAGRLLLSTASSTATLHAGAFVWDAGTLGFTLYPAPTPSNRIELAGALTKSSASAATRVLQLSNSFAAATHTLVTYASTDLTPEDFTATHSGLPAGSSAEFVVGPTELTVTFAPETAFTTWRRTKLVSSSNLGPAHDLADPDGDGRPNLLEYALGSEPLSADTAEPLALAVAPADGENAPRLALTFARVADPALTYAVVAADDPSGPWSGESAHVVFSSTGAENTEGPVTVFDTVPIAPQARRFLRLIVTR